MRVPEHPVVIDDVAFDALFEKIPEPQFREARERFLREMLARPSIFSDAAMRDRHEAHARRNIEESLRRAGTTG